MELVRIVFDWPANYLELLRAAISVNNGLSTTYHKWLTIETIFHVVNLSLGRKTALLLILVFCRNDISSFSDTMKLEVIEKTANVNDNGSKGSTKRKTGVSMTLYYCSHKFPSNFVKGVIFIWDKRGDPKKKSKKTGER